MVNVHAPLSLSLSRRVSTVSCEVDFSKTSCVEKATQCEGRLCSRRSLGHPGVSFEVKFSKTSCVFFGCMKPAGHRFGLAPSRLRVAEAVVFSCTMLLFLTLLVQPLHAALLPAAFVDALRDRTAYSVGKRVLDIVMDGMFSSPPSTSCSTGCWILNGKSSKLHACDASGACTRSRETQILLKDLSQSRSANEFTFPHHADQGWLKPGLYQACAAVDPTSIFQVNLANGKLTECPLDDLRTPFGKVTNDAAASRMDLDRSSTPVPYYSRDDGFCGLVGTRYLVVRRSCLIMLTTGAAMQLRDAFVPPDGADPALSFFRDGRSFLPARSVTVLGFGPAVLDTAAAELLANAKDPAPAAQLTASHQVVWDFELRLLTRRPRFGELPFCQFSPRLLA